MLPIFGDGTTIAKSTFTQVVANGAKAVAAGSEHSMVLKKDGSVWTAGSNLHGQLGDGSTRDRNYFMRVTTAGARGVAAGFGHSMFLTVDDGVWATGWNLYGQFGDGSITSTSIFTRVAEDSDGVHNAVTQTESGTDADSSVSTIPTDLGKMVLSSVT